MLIFSRDVKILIVYKAEASPEVWKTKWEIVAVGSIKVYKWLVSCSFQKKNELRKTSCHPAQETSRRKFLHKQICAITGTSICFCPSAFFSLDWHPPTRLDHWFTSSILIFGATFDLHFFSCLWCITVPRLLFSLNFILELQWPLGLPNPFISTVF